MPNFWTDDRFHYVSYVTGPTHNLLGIEFGDAVDVTPVMIKRPPIGSCSHGHIDEARLLKAVQDGVREGNEGKGTQYAIKGISYVANDVPRYDIYRLCAHLLVQCLAEGEQCPVASKPKCEND